MDNASSNLELEDMELVRLSLADPDKFSYIIQRYQEKLGRYLRRLGANNEEDIQDLLQDIFLKVYLNLNDFDQNLKFSSWIYRIAHNQVISSFRKKQVRPEAHAFPIDNIGFDILADDISLDKLSDIHLSQAIIKTALEKVSVKHREILILKFFEDKSYEEISDILKKPQGTVASLLNRAKKSLKNALPANILEN
ncbi:sigma-70 family RNA polymerase sigma factor [Patescibacteria group bacterium]|nr:sigma-70 family RNA polymerase sigma factor [Patescibacteria group bacterium]